MLKTEVKYYDKIYRSYWILMCLLLCSIGSSYAFTDRVNFDNYTVEDGLSHNRIYAIFQDSKGWVWLGNSICIERFDGDKFKKYGVFLSDTLYKESVIVRSFFENSKKELFVCVEDFGVAKYNRKKDRFESYRINGKNVLPLESVKQITEDDNGNVWAASKSGLHKIDTVTGNVVSFSYNPLNKKSLINNYVRKIKIDSSNDIWLITQGGVDVFNPTKEVFTHISNATPLLQEELWDVYFDSSGEIWFGTTTNGIVVYNPSNNSFKKIIPDVGNERSITVRAIYSDREGNYWIGTRGGLYVYDENFSLKQHYTNNMLEVNSLAHNSILDIYEDQKGDLWISTRGGLSYYVKENQNFSHYKAIPNDVKYLNNGEIYCFWEDEKENIWCGTESGGVNILNRKTGKYRYIMHKGLAGLSSNCIKAIEPDGLGNVLIGTFQGGLNVFNPTSGKIKYLLQKPKQNNSISGMIVWDIEIDKKGQIWVGTENGLDQYNPHSQTFVHYPEIGDMGGISWIRADSDNDLWLGLNELVIFRPGVGIVAQFNKRVRNFYEDSDGNYWVLTSDSGIALYDKYKGAIKYYNEKNGLASNLTFCIFEDSLKNLWISTANGLSCFNPRNETFKNYDKTDGLQANQFNYEAGYKTKKGELLFGGINGFNIFNPQNLKINSTVPPVYITNLKIFNKELIISDAKDALLSQSILETDFIEVPYKYNVLTFEFAALSYSNGSKNVYRYILEGFDDDWNNASEQRSATYTNLNPGEYVFRVVGGNPQGMMNMTGDTLKLRILPPVYRTWWFLTAIILMVILFLSLLFFQIVKRKNIKNAYLFEREKTKKLHEIDMFKFRFFTNISHEIKTPLTLIISPLEKMLKTDLDEVHIKKNHKIMYKNALHLLKLVNQLLDFRKLEAGKLIIEPKRGDIVKFTRDMLEQYEDMFSEKKIKCKFSSAQEEIITCFDPDKFEKIINNLLGNAIKFTNNFGSISVFLSIVIDEEGDWGEEGEKYIKIVVKDTGIGIEKRNIENIFRRFYSEKNEEKSGTGIGLAFTKELVELHKGRIFVESTPGEGSVFSILLPYAAGSGNQVEVKAEEDNAEVGMDTNTVDAALSDGNKKILLIVEDNKDVRQFIKSNFEIDYLVLEAENGKEGLDIAVKVIPTVIISDIMMPVMNGKLFCEKIKKDERTSHIPVILLSALSSKKHVMEGLANGADDYISKPFDVDVLQTKIDNLLALRKQLRDRFTREMVIKPSEVTISSPDERFLQRAIKTVEDNIEDPDFDVEKFSREFGISRMQLYRKLSALTNMTVKEFVNDLKMKRAEQLLLSNKLTVSETAYQVGFNDVSYFGRCFKKHFGSSPSLYIEQKLNG